MPEHFMLAGRKLLEALIVYTKIQVGPLKPGLSSKEQPGSNSEESKDDT